MTWRQKYVTQSCSTMHPPTETNVRILRQRSTMGQSAKWWAQHPWWRHFGIPARRATSHFATTSTHALSYPARKAKRPECGGTFRLFPVPRLDAPSAIQHSGLPLTLHAHFLCVCDTDACRGKSPYQSAHVLSRVPTTRTFDKHLSLVNTCQTVGTMYWSLVRSPSTTGRHDTRQRNHLCLSEIETCRMSRRWNVRRLLSLLYNAWAGIAQSV